MTLVVIDEVTILMTFVLVSLFFIHLMISFIKAHDLVLKLACSRGEENIDLWYAAKRVLSRDIRARHDGPDFNRAVMDGFALRSGDIRTPGVCLKVVGFVPAGSFFRVRIRKGECVSIATGAMVPKDADAVVAKEEVEVLGSDRVKILKKVSWGENIKRRARDFRRGKLLLKKGSFLNAACIGLLASQGIKTAPVLRLPRVALLSTGCEIVDLGQKKKPGQIWNSNGAMLSSALSSLNIPFVSLGLSGDSASSLLASIRRGLQYDCLVITGGVSVGERDLVPDCLKKLGVRSVFHKVSIRPGKPLLFAAKKSCLVFGLPGNPVSSLVAFLLFVRPALLKMLGGRAGFILEEGILAKDVYNKSGRLSFLPARLTRRGERATIAPLPYSGSADLKSMAAADVLFLAGPEIKRLSKNTTVRFIKVDL